MSARTRPTVGEVTESVNKLEHQLDTVEMHAGKWVIVRRKTPKKS